jgi:hypothetical protein
MRDEAVGGGARWWTLLWRIAMSVLIGFAFAAALGRIVQPFLFAVIAAAAIGGGAGVLLAGRRLARYWGVPSRQGGILIRILVGTTVLFATAFALTFGPLNVDRSFSVWMLKRISDTPGQTPTEVKERLSEFFSSESGEIQRRIDEQVLLGNLEVRGGSVELTNSGRRVVWANEALSRIFGLNPRYAQGQDLSDVP